jgi:hypothetical protein
MASRRVPDRARRAADRVLLELLGEVTSSALC